MTAAAKAVTTVARVDTSIVRINSLPMAHPARMILAHPGSVRGSLRRSPVTSLPHAGRTNTDVDARSPPRGSACRLARVDPDVLPPHKARRGGPADQCQR